MAVEGRGGTSRKKARLGGNLRRGPAGVIPSPEELAEPTAAPERSPQPEAKKKKPERAKEPREEPAGAAPEEITFGTLVYREGRVVVRGTTKKRQAFSVNPDLLVQVKRLVHFEAGVTLKSFVDQALADRLAWYLKEKKGGRFYERSEGEGEEGPKLPPGRPTSVP